MRYTVNTEKARKIHRTANISGKISYACGCVFPLATVVAMLCRPYIVGHVACAIAILSGLAFATSILLYYYTSHHAATPYIELMDHLKYNILGCHMRSPHGSNGFEGMQEVYFTYRDATGDTQEYPIGILEESTQHHLDAPMIDITRQIIYV